MRSTTGSKKEIFPGKWRVRVSYGYKRDGSQRQKSATIYGTEIDADRKIAQLLLEMGQSPSIGDGIKLTDYYNYFFLPAREATLTNATLNRYNSCWKNHIEPVFGHLNLDQIKHPQIQLWALQMTHSTADHCVRTLRVILRSAWTDELLDTEPMRHRVKLPPSTAKQPEVWTAEIVAKALPVMEGVPIEALWLSMIGGGLRKEEALALYWKDITFTSTDMLTVNEGQRKVEKCWIAHLKIYEALTLEDGRKKTKSFRSNRTVAISEPFSSRLYDLQGNPDDSICPVHPSTVAKAWRKLWDNPPKKAIPGSYKGRMKEVGIPYIQLRLMRHSHECIMASVVSDSLNSMIHGHSRSVEYSHYLRQDSDRNTAAALDYSSIIRDVKIS